MRSNSGNYVGNDAANRAIDHGLGRIPSLVLIHNTLKTQIIINGSASITSINDAATYAVTAVDSVSFYVGNAGNYPSSANGAATTYYWAAV